MHLVKKNKNKSRRKYDKIIIYLYDGAYFEFDLAQWIVYREPDWVEVVKKDGTEMNSFTVGNITHVKFMKVSDNKVVSMVKDSNMKPVPPTAA